MCSCRSVSLSGESERRLLHEICRRSAKAGRPVLCRTVSQSQSLTLYIVLITLTSDVSSPLKIH